MLDTERGEPSFPALAEFLRFLLVILHILLLSRRDYWSAVVDSEGCYGSGQDTCMMYLAFCHPVPPELGSKCYQSAICQKATTGSGEDLYVEEYSMGAFTNFTRFYESKSLPPPAISLSLNLGYPHSHTLFLLFPT